MNDKIITNGLVEYFKSNQWQELMRLLRQRDEEIYHIHMYVDNSVEAESLDKLITKYFELKGLKLDRKADVLAPNKSTGLALHNVHPHDPERNLYTPHFDLFWEYSPDVILKPADPSHGEENKNIIGWGKSSLDKFFSQFDFRSVGPREEWEIRQYFKSSHWKKFLRLMVDESYDHLHANVEINFHPWILKILAVEAFKEVGWKVDHVIPCIYRPPNYLGKLVFLLGYPEKVNDIAWVYNPDVVIRPASKKIFGACPPDGDIGFTVCLKSLAAERIKAGKYTHLSDEQIEEVLSKI